MKGGSFRFQITVISRRCKKPSLFRQQHHRYTVNWKRSSQRKKQHDELKCSQLTVRPFLSAKGLNRLPFSLPLTYVNRRRRRILRMYGAIKPSAASLPSKSCCVIGYFCRKRNTRFLNPLVKPFSFLQFRLCAAPSTFVSLLRADSMYVQLYIHT